MEFKYRITAASLAKSKSSLVFPDVIEDLHTSCFFVSLWVCSRMFCIPSCWSDPPMLLHYVSAWTEIETNSSPQCAKKAQGLMFLIVGTKLNQEVTYIEAESHFRQIFGIFMAEHLWWVGGIYVYISPDQFLFIKNSFLCKSYSPYHQKKSIKSFASWVLSTSKVYNIE